MEPKKLTGYADPLSAAPGERVRFMVSCYAPGSYRADLVRLICGDVTPDGAGFQEEEIETSISAEYPGREQPIFAGSSGCVGPSPVLRKLESLSVQALVWPTKTHKCEHAIVETWS